MTTHLTQNDSSNPIFSSYKYVDKNFNENMDEYVGKSAYEKMIEAEQKKQHQNININKEAINSIPVVPDMAMDSYNELNKMPDWYEQLQVFTPSEIEELKAKGKMGIAETWQKKKKWELVPFAGTSAEATLMVRNANTLRKIKNGQEVSNVDKELLVDFLRDVKELEIRGGHTFGGGATDIMLSSIPYLLEFAGGIATTEGGVGFASLAKTLSTIGAKKAGRKALDAALKKAATESVMTGTKKSVSLSAAKSIYKNAATMSAGEAMLNVGAKTAAKETLKAMPKVVGSTVKMTATRMPQAYVKNAADRQLSTGVHVTDAGVMAFDESEPLALSILKAFGETTFDNLTETAGWMFAPVTSYFAKPLRNLLPKKFFSGFEKLVSSRYGIKAGEALKKYGYDNVLEEMGEELLNRFLCQTFGINGLDEYNFDGFMNNVLYANDPAKWGQEALSFALMGGAGHVVVGSGSKAVEVWQKRKNEEKAKEITDYANLSGNQKFAMDSTRHEQLKKDFANYLTKHPLELKSNATVKDVDNALYKAQEAFIEESGISAEEFYLDQGFVKIKGSQSLAEQKLREKFKENGIDEGTADEFIKNSSELEIRDALKGQIQIDEQDAQKKRQKAVERISRGFQQGNIKDKRLADATGNLVVTMLEKASEVTNAPIEELIEKKAPKFKAVDEVGYAQDNTPLRSIDERLEALEQEFSSFSDEDFNEENADERLQRFEELENEYNELMELRNQGQEYYQGAYHGSPFEIDNISTDYVGTGEGAQAHGWGAYVAKNIDTGWEYRNRLNRNKDNDEAKVNGKTLSEIYSNLENQANRIRDNKEAQKIYNRMALIEELMLNKSPEEVIENYSNEDMGDMSDALDWFNKEIKPNLKYSGTLLEVDIPDDKELLDEDETIKEREDSGEDVTTIKEALEEIVKADEDAQLIDYSLLNEETELDENGNPVSHLWISNITDENLTGKEIYGTISFAMRETYGIDKNEADKLTSQLLDKYGIKGIRYDGEVDGECCVIFNGKNINSVKKYYQTDFNDVGKRVKVLYDRIKTILTGKKLSELAEEFEFINTFADEIKYAHDYYIENVNDKNENSSTLGLHTGILKKIQINFDAIGDDFIKFIETLSHEAEHARQEKEYKKVIRKQNKTDEDIEIINNYKHCKKVNRNLDRFYRKNKKIIDKINEAIKFLNDLEIQQYFSTIDKEELKTYNEFKLLFDEYDNATNEIKAQEAGENARRKAENIDTEILERYQSDFRRLKKRYNRTTSWGNIQSRQRSSSQTARRNGSQEQNQGNSLRYNQAAYTGSHINYDTPSLDFIGTGEGNQAHGYGLYYSKEKEIAEGYRKKLITSYNKKIDSIITIDGEEYTRTNGAVYLDSKGNSLSDAENIALRSLVLDETKEEAIKQLQKMLNEGWADNKKEEKDFKNAIKFLEKAKNIKTKNGQLYKVDIPDEKFLLDEDKKFSEQTKTVQKALKKLIEKEGLDFESIVTSKNSRTNTIEENKGRNIYRNLGQYYFEKRHYSGMAAGNFDYDAEKEKQWQNTSKLLNQYGIKGITYDGRLDGRCYVVFDDKAVKVLEKYYQFAGESSETADKYSLKNAKKMLKDGINPETVRKETGWFKGVDGKFRYEISDNDAVVNIDRVKKARQDEIDYRMLNITDYNNRMDYLVQQHDAKEISDEDFREQYDSLMNRKLEEVQDLQYYENKAYTSYLSGILDHEKLYAAYPSLRTLRVEFRPLEFGVMGQYSEKNREIIISQALWVKGEEAELKKTLMHEIQHFIQHQEGFAVGGNQKNIEIILADAKDAINNSKDSKEYDFVMKKYSIVNNLLLIRSIQNKPENITKSYWWMQQGKGWYAPKKTRKKERAKYINDCCQEFIDYSIQKHKDNNTFEGYKNYSKKDTAELKKEARRLNYRAGKVLDRLSPDYKNLDKIEHALNQLDRYEVNTFDLYKRLAGETEARNTENRVDLSDKERLEKAPSETADVPSNEQLVVFDDGTEAFSESNDMSDDGNDISDKLQKIKGSYIPTERIIELFKDADESTIVHELAHWYLDLINEYAQYSEELTQDLEKVRAFLKNDGGEFTREQHEKFARAFEAYIRTGYARNNRLKKIFEDFKNWLISIYDDIKKIVYTENGVDKYFTDDEVKTIQNLFDRLLTSEKERIKTTVFDKVQEVEDKINAIKENEKKELDELDKIYKDNIAALNRQSDKKRSVQEYLDLADKMTSRETKEVKNFKERFKKATLDILEIATGYDRKFIANSRNWEKVQFALENAEDKITISGFAPEWGEFYSPDGVTYDNDEIGGDYNLASQAFKVLTEGEYNKTFDEDYQFEDINKFSAKVDYLAAKVKTLKGDERSAAMEAMFSLFDEMPSLPDEVAQSLLQKVREVAQEAEEDSREDYNSRVLTSIPIIQQLQYIVTKKLNDLKVYNPEMRYKMRLSKSHRLYRYIKDIKSINSAKKQIRRINEFIIDDMRNNQRSLLHNEIQKQIKVNSKLVKSGTISKGKFDWRTNTVFAELVELNKLKREEAEAQLGAILQIQDAAKGENRDSFDENETAEFNKTNNFQQNLKNKFIQYRSMKVQDLDVEHTILLLQDILELKEKGRQAKSEQDFINKTQKWNTRNNLLDILEVTKQSGAKFGANWVAGVGKGVSLNGGTLANWESLLNSIFNKDTAQKYSLLLDEANSDIYARKHILNFYQRAFDIYGFRKPSSWDRFLDYDDMQPIIKLFQDYDNEKYTYIQKVFSINSPDGFARSSIEISKSQMITMFAWSLNEKLEQRLFNQFGVEQIRDMFEQRLSDEDKELAWALIDTCEDMRDDINEVFINTTGLSLPKVENYFPSKAERVQSDLDLYHDNWVKSSSPSFIKERKTCNRIPMKPLSPLEILIPHINKTAKYVVMSEHVNFLNQVFKDTAIKTKMQEIWGSEDGAKIYQTLINKLAACTFTNYSKGTNLVAGALDTLSRNYITSAIGFSPKVALGQLLSVVNYAENMPAGVWAKGFVKTLAHPVENFKYMLDNCEYLQTRLAGNSQNEVIAILTSEKDRFRTLRNFMTSNVKWGDIIAITLGGKPYVDYLMQQGMEKEDAFNLFVENTLRAQQAGTTSSISEWQSAQAKNCLTRMFFAFRNTDMQYERKFIDTLIQGKKGEIGKKELIKKVFIYKILNPFMFTSFLQNMALIAFFRGIFAGDEPDEVIFGGLRNAIEAIMLGGLNAYGFAGFIASSVVESIIAAFDKEFKHFEKVVPVMSDFDHQVQKYLKGDLDFADYVDALAIGSEYALGVPTTKVVNTVEGMGDVAQGNIGVGLSRMAGWGRYTATKAWTGKAPKKR